MIEETGQEPEAGQDQSTAPDLTEFGVAADEDGKISLDDHKKLLSALKALRQQTKAQEKQLADAEKVREDARLSALSEAERQIEEAKAEGRRAAEADFTQRLLKTGAAAHAATLGFADPGDVARFIDWEEVATEADVKKQVAELAKSKPYLLTPRQSLPQGPRGDGKPPKEDWLRSAMRSRR